MKNRTRNDYLRRIDRVIALLQQVVANDAELPDLAELGQAAQLSPFHFHRVYRALTGETIGRTVARLRLLSALQLLSDPAQAVTDAALAVGYETPQAFARAFRQAFGASPSELRAQPARVAGENSRGSAGRPWTRPCQCRCCRSKWSRWSRSRWWPRATRATSPTSPWPTRPCSAGLRSTA